MKSKKPQTTEDTIKKTGKMNHDLSCDVLVVGGGLVGLTLGVAVASSGVVTAVIDREKPEIQKAAPFDGRCSAIAQGSQRIFQGVGLWDGMEWAAEPILHIKITDGQVDHGASPLGMNYDHREVGRCPMGWIVENRAIRLSAYARAATLPLLHHLAPESLTRLDRDENQVTARLSGGQKITAQVVIGADGRGSFVRQKAGIKITGKDYEQDAIVATLYHEKPHQGIAFEHFLPSGPFALLPLPDDEEGRHRSSLVWSEKRTLTEHFMALGKTDFIHELHRRFGFELGAFDMENLRWRYPLGALHAERYCDQRLALVGDAAHGTHPIAGQGLNLGLRDVAALAEVLVDAKRMGHDLGSDRVLESYVRWRRFDNVVLLSAMDGLVRLFSNDLTPLRIARDLGLATVGRIPPLKRFFMKHAMGLIGDLPRLMKGEGL